MTHTPGPWEIQAIPQPRQRRGFEYVIRDKRNCALAEVGHIDAITDGAEGEANALLIASAPDLLAALKAITGRLLSATSMLNSLGCPTYYADALPILLQARAAIAKATGETE